MRVMDSTEFDNRIDDLLDRYPYETLKNGLL